MAVELLFLVIPLFLAALLFIILGLFVQRASKALAETRAIAGFQREASDLATRIDGTLEQLATRVDAVRRQQVQPGEIQAELRTGLDVMAGYLEEARKIRTPDELTETRNLIAQDIQRGARALEMVLHGVRMWSAGYGRHTELEAQTAIKRGYLNLLHTRETIGEHLSDLAEARAAGDRKWRTSRI